MNKAVAGNFPEVWMQSIIMPLYKGIGDKHNTRNYRSISIMPPLTNLYSHLLLHHMLEVTKLQSLYTDCQSGLQKQYRLENNIP